MEAGDGDTKDYAFRAPTSTSTVKTGDQRIQDTGTSNLYGKDSVTLDEYGEPVGGRRTAWPQNAGLQHH